MTDLALDPRPHLPLPVRVSSRCRVDCCCGWRGSVVSTFGAGQTAWIEHFRAERDIEAGPRPDVDTSLTAVHLYQHGLIDGRIRGRSLMSKLANREQDAVSVVAEDG